MNFSLSFFFYVSTTFVRFHAYAQRRKQNSLNRTCKKKKAPYAFLIYNNNDDNIRVHIRNHHYSFIFDISYSGTNTKNTHIHICIYVRSTKTKNKNTRKQIYTNTKRHAKNMYAWKYYDNIKYMHV